MNVAEFLALAVQRSPKRQYEIAREAGFRSPNIITMLKTGQTRIPYSRVPALASALGLSPRELMNRCLSEYDPDLQTTLSQIYAIDTSQYTEHCNERHD